MVTGLISTNGPSYDGNGTAGSGESGSGYVIGKGWVLTAGHVVYEWNRSYPTVSPQIVTNSGLVVDDYRHYADAYRAAVQNELNNHPSSPAANEVIEGRISQADTVAIKQSNATVNSSSAGLVYFVDPNDLKSFKTALGASATLSRKGVVSNSNNGSVLQIYSGGGFQFSGDSEKGDSGGAYILAYGGHNYVVGTHDGKTQKQVLDSHGNPVIGTDGKPKLTPDGHSKGTFFTKQEFYDLNTLIQPSGTTDPLNSEPTNLIVGSSANDTIAGTFRKDIILAGAGNDTITASSGDEVDGGAGNDVIKLAPTAGQPEAIKVDFSAGGGSDVVEAQLGASGTYNLNLKGLNASDISIIAGGEDLYGGFAYYDGQVAFEFVTFKVNSTGETITFTDSNKSVGTNASPTWAEAGTDYAAQHSPISSVTFADGSVWNAATLWSHINNKSQNSDVTWDLMFRGDYNVDTFDRQIEHNDSQYGSYINSTYFQADPIATSSSTSNRSSSGFDSFAHLLGSKPVSDELATMSPAGSPDMNFRGNVLASTLHNHHTLAIA